MAGRDWTRQGALALFVLSAALLGGCGKEEKAVVKEEIPPELGPPRQFNSKLPLYVWAQVEQDAPARFIGQTPSELPLAVPCCRVWWVEPVDGPDMAALAGEVDVQRIPGLRLPYFVSDDDLVLLEGLTGLRMLDLSWTKVTDAGLAHLEKLKGLQWLDLSHAGATDTGQDHLDEVEDSGELGLKRTPLTNAGLVHLEELKGLQILNLSHSKVTDAGLVHLKGLRKLRSLDLTWTEVTDAGLAHLKELKELRVLNLDETRVTDAAIAELMKSLPNVTVP